MAKSIQSIEEKKNFTRGFICAVAALLNGHGHCIEATELFRAAGDPQYITSVADRPDIETLVKFGYLPDKKILAAVAQPK